ncbi:MAG: hypothetical protein EOO89_28730 [Pedobacter sp.]|nr:MAG: hypothetical protein EOO89_28730 [Pedobacter sp.]
MNKLLLKIYLPVLLFLCGCSGENAQEIDEVGQVEGDFLTLNQHISEKYNRDIAFYANLTRPSKGCRFYVLNLKVRKVIEKGLCLNGKTDEAGKVIYSNTPGSNCSSQGVAKVLTGTQVGLVSLIHLTDWKKLTLICLKGQLYYMLGQEFQITLFLMNP